MAIYPAIDIGYDIALSPAMPLDNLLSFLFGLKVKYLYEQEGCAAEVLTILRLELCFNNLCWDV